MFPKMNMRPVIVLAPMAGYTTPDFRAMCSACGADLVYSEMVSAAGLMHGGRATKDLLERHPAERGLVVQLFGGEPEVMAAATDRICRLGVADGVDINFGCPVKKVARSGAGAVLMQDLARARDIVTAVVAAATVPVSCKVRLGWSPSRPNAAAFVAMAAEAGCSHVVVHGRWATQFYRGTSDLEALRDVVTGAALPVVVNGDIDSLAAARQALDVTGAQGVAIGRAAVGRPDLFAELRRAFDPAAEVEAPPADSRRRRLERARELLAVTIERVARRGRGAPAYVRLRSHLMYLLAAFDGAAVLRRRIVECRSDDELDGILTDELRD